MSTNNTLRIKIDKGPTEDPTTNFFVQPPLNDAEVTEIAQTQGPRSMLGEFLTYRTENGAGFSIPELPEGIEIAIGEELALSVMAIRGIDKATMQYGSTETQIG